jgi:hypothetical protein
MKITIEHLDETFTHEFPSILELAEEVEGTCDTK